MCKRSLEWMNTEIEQLFFDICNLEKKKIWDYKDCARGYNFYDNIQEYQEYLLKKSMIK